MAVRRRVSSLDHAQPSVATARRFPRTRATEIFRSLHPFLAGRGGQNPLSLGEKTPCPTRGSGTRRALGWREADARRPTGGDSLREGLPSGRRHGLARPHARGVARIVDGENSQGRRETRERLATKRITMQCPSGPFQLIMQPRFDDLSQRNEGIIAPKRAESF